MPYDMEHDDHGGGGGDNYHEPSMDDVKQAAAAAAMTAKMNGKCVGCTMALLGEYVLSRSLGFAIHLIHRDGGSVEEAASVLRETLQHVTDEAIKFAKSYDEDEGDDNA